MEIPKPRSKSTAKRIVFETKNYHFKDGKIINLPVRPAPTGDLLLDRNTSRNFVSALKASVLNLEESNRSYIIIMHSNDNWWEFGANSLLFYLYHLQNHFALTTLTPRFDRDFGKVKYPNNPGCVIIKNLEIFMQNVIQKTRAELVLDSPELKILRLRISYSDETVNSFRTIRTAKEARFNSLVTPRTVHPATYRSIINLTKLIADKTKDLHPSFRDHYCTEGIEITKWLSLKFIAMACGRYPVIQYYTESADKLNQLSDWFGFVKAINILDLNTCTNLMDSLEDLRSRMKSDLIKEKELAAAKAKSALAEENAQPKPTQAKPANQTQPTTQAIPPQNPKPPKPPTQETPQPTQNIPTLPQIPSIPPTTTPQANTPQTQHSTPTQPTKTASTFYKRRFGRPSAKKASPLQTDFFKLLHDLEQNSHEDNPDNPGQNNNKNDPSN